MAALARKRITVMTESTIEFEPTEDETVTDEVSDEAIEAAATGTEGRITLRSLLIFFTVVFADR
jgi:hypothetical protein